MLLTLRTDAVFVVRYLPSPLLVTPPAAFVFVVLISDVTVASMMMMMMMMFPSMECCNKIVLG
jgi:hypothetical protein